MYYLLLILPLSECYRIRTSILDMSDPSLSKMASNPMHSPILPDKHWYALFLPSERTSTHYYNRTFTQALVSFFALLYLYVSLNAQIRNITLLQLRIITIRSIKRRHRIMPQYTVFRHCCRSQCLGIFVKQTVMPHTKSHHNIQVRFRLVQKLCLQDRITHIHTDTFAAFRDADRCLLLCSGFTADTIHLKAMSAQDICQDTAFFQQSDTCCDPNLFRINLLCKIHDFFDTGMFAVILILYFITKN